ncbi:hypothetical protein D3C85_1505860 [compost metagenome]
MFRVRIAPTDREEVQAATDRVFDKAASRRHVEEVVLADHRRHQEHRTLTHRGGDRVIFDQLEHLAAIHHRTWGDPQVLADFKAAGIHLSGHAAIMQHVVEPVFAPSQQTGSARIEGFLQRRRITQQGIGRRGGTGP